MIVICPNWTYAVFCHRQKQGETIMNTIALMACVGVLLVVGYFTYCVAVTMWLELRERTA